MMKHHIKRIITKRQQQHKVMSSSSILEQCGIQRAKIKALLAVVLVLLVLGFGGGKKNSDATYQLISSSSRRMISSSDDESISLACQATRYPSSCISSLSNDSRSANASPQQLIQISVDIAFATSSRSLQLTKYLLNRASGNKNLTAAATDCVQVLGFARHRFQQCTSSLAANFSTRSVKDSEAWLSAILSYQYDCFSALGYVNSSSEVQQMMIQVESGITDISNSLSMLDAFDLYGPNSVNWKPPPSKRTNESVSTLQTSAYWLAHTDRHLLHQHRNVVKKRIHAVVAKDGSSELQSVQQAIDNAPENSKERYIIHIKQGVYKEQVLVPAAKTMIMLIGDGAGKTIISGSQFVHEGVTTMETATMVVVGDGFVARDLTVENTGGPEVHQAVALRIDADQAAFESCTFMGFQDTLYSHTLRHYFLNCTITGTVDFIFGNAASVFEKCTILVRAGRKGVSTSMVSAHGRIDPSQVTGFAFVNCTLDASQDYLPIFISNTNKYKTYLGRPWKLYSRSVFIECFLGNIVAPEGWLAWKGDFALDTLFFGEYKSHGPGAEDLSRRVSWSTQMEASQLPAYSTQNFIQGNEWPMRLHL